MCSSDLITRLNPGVPHAIKTSDDCNALLAHGHEAMFGDLHACLLREGQRQDFARSNVPRVVRVGKFGNG